MARLIIALAFLSLVLVGCNPPEVVQGNVVELSADGSTLTLQDELPPNQTLNLTVSGADVGAPPAPGDTVRVAFYRRGNELVATRVMNLTRQAELAKKQ